MFQPTDQPLDLKRSDFRRGVVERRRTTKRALRCSEPFPGRLDGSLEQRDRGGEDAGHPRDPVRLVWLEPALGFSSAESSRRDLDGIRQLNNDETRIPEKALPGLVRQPLAYGLDEVGGLGRPKPQESDERVAYLTSRFELIAQLSEIAGLDGRSRGSLAWCHLAVIYTPTGIASRLFV